MASVVAESRPPLRRTTACFIRPDVTLHCESILGDRLSLSKGEATVRGSRVTSEALPKTLTLQKRRGRSLYFFIGHHGQFFCRDIRREQPARFHLARKIARSQLLPAANKLSRN